jgi:hypothetical protein
VSPALPPLSELPPDDAAQIDRACEAYEAEWDRIGCPPPLEPFLETVPEPLRPALRRELLRVERGVLPVVAGFEVLGVQGAGGMGIVYRARDKATGGLVALKRIRAVELLGNPRLRQRWEMEREILVGLQHPHVVRIERFGEHDGEPFLVMPLVTGGDLKQHLGEFRLDLDGLGPDELGRRQVRVAALVEKIARAI